MPDLKHYQEELRKMILEARHAVFFGGAGVSTESGIPDFRSVDGLYHQKWSLPPEEIISRHFFVQEPAEFWRFYREKMLFPDAKPNAAHLALAHLEQKGHLACVITQNIDGLHQAAGSRNVVELHGSVHRNHCTRCGRYYSLENVMAMDGVPKCFCGGIIKPDVVLYEESLPIDALEQAADEIEKADLMIVGGTSLSVYPAASFVLHYRGRLVIINKSPTPQDYRATLLIPEKIGQTMSALMDI